MAESETNPVATPEALWEAECARRMLLSHLGITPLVSRFDPIAAKPAQRLDAPPASVNPVPSNVPTTAKAGDEMQAGQLREMLRGDADAGISDKEAGTTLRVPVQEAGDLADDGSESPTSGGSNVATDTPLSLLLVTSGDVLWAEVLEDQLLRKEQLQLIAAMARAIRGPSVRCAHQQFDWPPAEGSAIVASGSMQDVLSGFLHRLTGDHATRHIVQLGPCEVLPGWELPIHQVPSSLEMLRDGSLKQSAWSVLKQLRSGD